VQSVWLKGSSDKDARTKEIKGFRNAFDELRKVLENDFGKKPAFRDYTDSNWMAKQIAVNEYNQVLEDIYKLINITD
jgi:hypothetical protein